MPALTLQLVARPAWTFPWCFRQPECPESRLWLGTGKVHRTGSLLPGRGNLFSSQMSLHFSGWWGHVRPSEKGEWLYLRGSEVQVWLFFREYLLFFFLKSKSFFRGWLSYAAPGPSSSQSFQTVASLSSLVLATLLPFPRGQCWGWESEVLGTKGFASVCVHFRQYLLLSANIPGWPRPALCWLLPPPRSIPWTRAFGLPELWGWSERHLKTQKSEVGRLSHSPFLSRWSPFLL